ncbi:hypothetical protein [Streptomyces sp. PSKA30]|uniref:hypothetical protein n=1 Tax=Streptomyces sp. PSKA30 TaxID=2874597 RepID=UPI001CD0C080|nr:hypothetical protein [Streptomyces sp. PSKA30]MBZ9644307.1 hypothetical protein [Streptomyces sp. PSKA30]
MVGVLSAAAAATAACSPKADPADGKSSSPVSEQKPLTEAELTDALPVGADFPGFIAEPQTMPLLEAEDVVTVDKPACRPIADMMSVRPKHPRQAMVWATIKANDAPSQETPGSVTLTSHTGQEAEAWMDELKEALTSCTTFTATSERGWTHRFTIRPLLPVTAGDDSVTYLLTNALAPDGKGNFMTVVRTGGTFATYLMNQYTGKPGPIAASIADQQHTKLQAIAANP